ncbi:MAG: 50S ribosomal protein L6 [Proteobacteria bacterium]|nr:50S ribosomal protein L6 [Pseudomonadota bacterium]MCP4918229.1 50S ribosomal protein L6 [Pseudomonadota bacterium]
MSRIGNQPIELPKGVSVTLGDVIVVKGPKGSLEQSLVDGVSIAQDGDVLKVSRASDNRVHRANHGLIRALVANMVTGVSKGFERKLEIIGVGYKAENKGKHVVFNLGYSHPIEFTPPQGVTIAIEKNTKVTVSGIDKQVVGQAAADIRGFRSPDSYKGKGVRYAGEVIRLKAGKAAKK